MKATRTLMVLCIALLLGTSSVVAQSLADVAKKEKKRRETNKEEAKRVITERELTYGYGGGPATTSTVTVPGGSDATDAGEGGEGNEGSADGNDGQQDETRTREYWQGRLNAAREKIAGIEQRIREEDQGEGLRPGVDPMGPNVVARRQDLDRQLAAARAELEAIQAEGRRAGVPPGWVR